MNQDIINRGQDAKRVLETPEFKQTIEQVRKDIFNQFVRTNVADAERREDLFKVVNGLETFVAKLKSYVSDAEIEIARADAMADA